MNEKQYGMIIPQWLFQENSENKPRKIYGPEALREIARDSLKLDDKQMKKGLAKKINNPYYFIDKALKFVFNITLDSHLIIHSNSNLTNKLNFIEKGIKARCVEKI